MTIQSQQTGTTNYWPGTYRPTGVRLRERPVARFALDAGLLYPRPLYFPFLENPG